MFLNPNRRAAGLLGSLFALALACRVSAASVGHESSTADVAEPASWQAAVPIDGFKPLYGEPVMLDARQSSTCSANGSNFCFGDNVNFCATCGICCGSSSSGYCCGADQICCGSACCAAGQTCNNGACLLPLATVIVTSATQVTVSHVATQVVTVEQQLVSTSTIFSTTEVTVSSGGTQTDIVYMTVTASPAKRAVVVEVVEPRSDGLWDTLSLFVKRFSFPWTAPGATSGSPGQVGKRALRATQAVLTPISSSTVITTSITRTSDVTSFVSLTTTVPTSSIFLTTVFQTKTRVVGAGTTVTTTSTLTVTPKVPVTQTVTKTATNTPNPDPNKSSSSSSTSASDTSTPTPGPAGGGSAHSGLSTGAIAGIAGGIGGAAVLALVVALLWWLKRRRARGPPHQDPSSYLEPYIPDMSSPIPGPRSSPSNRFGAGAAAAHHAGSSPSPDGGVKNLDRYSNISGGPGKKPLSPRLPDGVVEAPGNDVYEADGTSRVPVGGPIYEADGAERPRPPYPLDAGEMEDSSSPVGAGAGAGQQRGHTRQASSSSSRYGGSQGLDGTGFSPVAEMGEGAERIRNTNPYRTPGAYRDF